MINIKAIENSIISKIRSFIGVYLSSTNGVANVVKLDGLNVRPQLPFATIETITAINDGADITNRYMDSSGVLYYQTDIRIPFNITIFDEDTNSLMLARSLHSKLQMDSTLAAFRSEGLAVHSVGQDIVPRIAKFSNRNIHSYSIELVLIVSDIDVDANAETPIENFGDFVFNGN